LTRRSTCTGPDGVVAAHVLRLVPAGQQASRTGTCAAAGCGFRGSGDAAELEPCTAPSATHARCGGVLLAKIRAPPGGAARDPPVFWMVARSECGSSGWTWVGGA